MNHEGEPAQRVYRPTTRVLAVLELLQTHGQLSGTELSRRLGVMPRTLRRYVAQLEEMGVPIATQQGRHGGYRLVEGFKLPPMMFTEDEALAVSVGLVAARCLGLREAGPALASAQAKLERVLPRGVKRRVRDIDETVVLDMTSPAASSDGAVFAAMSRAMRTLRIDRVASVQVADVVFHRPEDFDVLQHLERSVATLPRTFGIEVMLRTGQQRAQAAVWPSLGVLESCGDGVLLRAQADDLDWFAAELARLPFEFEIRKPDALRKALAARAALLTRLASDAGPVEANGSSAPLPLQPCHHRHCDGPDSGVPGQDDPVSRSQLDAQLTDRPHQGA